MKDIFLKLFAKIECKKEYKFIYMSSGTSQISLSEVIHYDCK